ncbi:iron uptake system protein EfeO [Thiomonas intermedia]|uniref:iron uptake system protein EfeO n=1 Tax=Thiomonas intermedia TaxID=926 RepID=UPI0009A48222|nr:iron uptake system protein EfeO [Thiomonas intermedia]
MKRFAMACLLGASLLGSPLAAQAATPASLDLVTPITDYKIYVTKNINELVTQTRAFTTAVKKGDVATAKKLFGPTRVHYERIEPIAELFSDLDASMDSREDDHEKGVNAPDFTGFHRIEYGLWIKNSTTGLTPFADKLMADVLDLQKRINGMTFPPDKVVGGSAALMEEVAATKISGEEDRYSHTDLYDFQANVDGSKKIFDLFRPQLPKGNEAYVAKVEKNFGTVNTILDKYKTQDGGYVTYDKVTEKDRKILSGAVNTLAEDLSMLRGKLGLS